MYTIDKTTISLTRGDSFFCEVGIYKNGEVYTPQSGDSIRFALKPDVLNSSKTDYKAKTPLILKTIPTDTLILHLNPEDTKYLDFGDYVYDIQITFANGDVDTFIPESKFIITPEVD